RDRTGIVTVGSSRFRIERGRLAEASDPHEVWRLAEPASERWLAAVREHQWGTFGDVATVRVGIKSTADAVFVRDDWHELPQEQRPEAELLRPLITHREAGRWRLGEMSRSLRVLYPHVRR